jgi:hypothetical protein
MRDKQKRMLKKRELKMKGWRMRKTSPQNLRENMKKSTKSEIRIG